MYYSYIAEIYGKALYKVTGPSLEKEVKAFKEVLGNYNFLADRKIKNKLKLIILESLHLSKELFNFFKIIIHNKRENIVLDILDAYFHIIKVSRGECDVYITSYADIDKENLKKISQILIDRYKDIKKVNMKNTINKKLLGGFTLRLRSEIIDLSIIKKLEQIKQLSIDALSALN